MHNKFRVMVEIAMADGDMSFHQMKVVDSWAEVMKVEQEFVASHPENRGRISVSDEASGEDIVERSMNAHIPVWWER